MATSCCALSLLVAHSDLRQAQTRRSGVEPWIALTSRPLHAVAGRRKRDAQATSVAVHCASHRAEGVALPAHEKSVDFAGREADAHAEMRLAERRTRPEFRFGN